MHCDAITHIRATTGPCEGMAATGDYWRRTLDAAMLDIMRCREEMAEDLCDTWGETGTTTSNAECI